VDVLVELRASVRAKGLDALKKIKGKGRGAGKTGAAAAANTTASGACVSAAAGDALSVSETEATLSQMLQACDRARNGAKAAGVVIVDAGNVSTWRRE